MTVSARRAFTTLALVLASMLMLPVLGGSVIPHAGAAPPDESVVGVPQDRGAPSGEQDVEQPGPEGPSGEAPVVPGTGDGGLEAPDEIVLPDGGSVPSDDQPAGTEPDTEIDDPDGARDDAAVADGQDSEPESHSARRTAPGTPGSRISMGHNHSLYLDGAGQIWSWGANGSGQLGVGNSSGNQSRAPVKVDMDGAMAGADIVAVSAGGWHSMALDSEGRVYAWGYNARGALGDGSTTDRWRPIQVGGLLEGRRIVQIASGGGVISGTNYFNSSAAVDEDGRVYTWGSGQGGRLGTGATPAAQTTPALVRGLISDLRIVDISVGYQHTIALSHDGRLFSWGYQDRGSLGTGATGTAVQSSPVAVAMDGALADVEVVQVSSGWTHSLVLSADGATYAWGLNHAGQLGTGAVGGSAFVPVRTDAGAFDAIGHRPVQVDAGYDFTISTGEHGRAALWRQNWIGQLGNGTTTTSARPGEPYPGVMGGSRIIEVSAGASSALALSDDGRLFSWGAGGELQLGDGLRDNSAVPVQVGGMRVVNQPKDVVVEEGEEALFEASSNESGARVRWQVSTDHGTTWSSIDGATATSYSTGPARAEMNGWQFRVFFTSTGGSPFAVYSREATLTVRVAEEPPTITLHPRERVRSLGGLSVELTADAMSSSPMSVQWQSSSDEGATWTDVAEARGTSHEFTATQELHGVLYRAVFTNRSGSSATSPALLEVLLAAPSSHLEVTPTSRQVANLGGER